MLDQVLNVISTTLSKWSPNAVDQVLNGNALLFCYKNIGKLKNMVGNKNMGSVVVAPGGKAIDETVVVKENTNAGWVNYNEDLASNEQQVVATATFSWKTVYANAVAFKGEILANQDSEYRKINLVKTLVDNAENSLINKIGAGLYNLTSANAKAPNGLPELITDDGTGTVGGLSTTTYPLWANQYENLAASHTPAQLREAMGKLYRKCRNGTDIIVCHPDLYGEYEASLTAQVQVQTFKGLEDAWFDYLRFHRAVVIFDENCPQNRMYFINTKALVLNFMKGAEITVGEKEHPAGTQKYIWPIMAMMNWSVRSRRDLGVLVVAAAQNNG